MNTHEFTCTLSPPSDQYHLLGPWPIACGQAWGVSRLTHETAATKSELRGVSPKLNMNQLGRYQHGGWLGDDSFWVYHLLSPSVISRGTATRPHLAASSPFTGKTSRRHEPFSIHHHRRCCLATVHRVLPLGHRARQDTLGRQDGNLDLYWRPNQGHMEYPVRYQRGISESMCYLSLHGMTEPDRHLV